MNKYKVLINKKVEGAFGTFIDLGGRSELGSSTVPQLFPETCTMDGLKEFSSEEIVEQLKSGDWYLSDVYLEEPFGGESKKLNELRIVYAIYFVDLDPDTGFVSSMKAIAYTENPGYAELFTDSLRRSNDDPLRTYKWTGIYE